MAQETRYVDPTSAIGGDAEDIDDGIRDPSTDYDEHSISLSDPEDLRVTFDEGESIDNIVSISAKILTSSSSGSGDVDVDLHIGEEYQGFSTISVPEAEDRWHTVTWEGDWTGAELNNAELYIDPYETTVEIEAVYLKYMLEAEDPVAPHGGSAAQVLFIG